MKISITHNDRQRIIELYECGDDKRTWFIAFILGLEEYFVQRTIREYINNQIEFERGNYLVLHSSINYQKI